MKRLLVFSILTLLMAGPAHAIVVHLKDGSRVTGTIVSATARDIQFHTPDGMLTIPNERIARIEYGESEAPPQPVADPAPAAAPLPPPTQSRLNLYQNPTGGDRPQYFSLGMGVAFPLSRVDFGSTGGGTDDNGDGGLSLSGEYLYQISPRWATGMNLEYIFRSRTASQSLLPASGTDVFGHTLLVMPTAKFSFVSEGMVRPYVLGGVGANRTSTIIEATPNLGYEWSDTNTDETRTLVDQARWGLATTLRTGLDFYWPWDPQVFSLELGWTHLANRSYGATQAGQDLGLTSVDGNLDILMIAFRMGWRF